MQLSCLSVVVLTLSLFASYCEAMALDSEQRQVLTISLDEAARQGATPREKKALVEALLVESNIRNLNHGDRDSSGPLQQRPSQGWKHPRNVRLATRDFIAHARQLRGQSGTAGRIAQGVQRSAFPGRYDEKSGVANELLGKYSGGTPVADNARGASVSSGTSTSTVDNPDALKRVALAQYLTRTNPNSLLLRTGAISVDEPTSSTSEVPTPPASGAGARIPFGTSGNFKITGPNPDRIQPGVTNFLRKLGGVAGETIVASDGTGHSKYTTNGNISEHYTGNATDIPATGNHLTRLGQDALVAAGMPEAQARKITGGLYNVVQNGKRYQIIFNTNEGGNHYNHLHVGVKKL